MDDEADDDLMLAVQKEDTHAFEILVRRHVDALYGYAYRLCRNNSDADDLVQDTFLNVWQKSHTYKAGKVKLTTWMHRVLYNKFVDETRRARPATAETDVNELADSRSPAQSHEAARDLERIESVLDALPETQRAAIVLSHMQGLNNQQTAEILGTTVRAVESLLARARRALREELER